MNRGRNLTEDSKGGSTFAGAGSIPVDSSITEQRAEATAIVASLSRVTIRNMAHKHWTSESWIRRYLRHSAYWRPALIIACTRPSMRSTWKSWE